MRMQFAGQRKPALLAKVAAATRPIPKLWTSVFHRIAWPYIEFVMRLWIARLFGFFGFMQMLHWETTLAVAGQENPIPFLAPNSAAFLSTAVYLVCAGLLMIGFMTRYAALPLLLLSMIAQVRYTPAKQGGTYAARQIRAMVELRGPMPAFRYRHLGSLATIDRKAAVADFGRLKLSGAPAWWLWGLVHIAFILGVRNRFATLTNWFWAYLKFGGNIRLITGGT